MKLIAMSFLLIFFPKCEPNFADFFSMTKDLFEGNENSEECEDPLVTTSTGHKIVENGDGIYEIEEESGFFGFFKSKKVRKNSKNQISSSNSIQVQSVSESNGPTGSSGTESPIQLTEPPTTTSNILANTTSTVSSSFTDEFVGGNILTTTKKSKTTTAGTTLPPMESVDDCIPDSDGGVLNDGTGNSDCLGFCAGENFLKVYSVSVGSIACCCG